MARSLSERSEPTSGWKAARLLGSRCFQGLPHLSILVLEERKDCISPRCLFKLTPREAEVREKPALSSQRLQVLAANSKPVTQPRARRVVAMARPDTRKTERGTDRNQRRGFFFCGSGIWGIWLAFVIALGNPSAAGMQQGEIQLVGLLRWQYSLLHRLLGSQVSSWPRWHPHRFSSNVRRVVLSPLVWVFGWCGAEDEV